MSTHFRDFIAERESPGILLIPSSRSIGAATEGILCLWWNAEPDDFRNRIQTKPS